MRESRGIGLVTGPRRWTAQELRLLGTLSDHEVGRRLRRAVWAVYKQRTALKIPPFRPRGKWRPWKASELVLLTKLPAAEAARRLKRSVKSIRRQRCRLGMRQFESRRWSKAEGKWWAEPRTLKRPAGSGAHCRRCARGAGYSVSSAPPRNRENGSPRRTSCWAPCQTGRWPGVWAAPRAWRTSGGRHWAFRRSTRPQDNGARAKSGCWAPGLTPSWPAVAVQRARGGKETFQLEQALPRPAFPQVGCSGA